MKKILPCLLFCISSFAFSQTGQWAWIGGDSIAQSGFDERVPLGPYDVYGNMGEPSVNNKPPARIDAAEWTDKEGNLWMYGGYVAATGFYAEGFFGDLWKYNPSTNEWTWVDGIAGYNVFTSVGRHGAKGEASVDFGPGRRRGALSWTDEQGNLWLMGGYGRERYYSLYNDLWKFDPSSLEWAWMGGGLVYGGGMGGGMLTFIKPEYGTKGVPSTENFPAGTGYGSEFDPDVTWVDAAGNLWFLEKVLWRYNPSTAEWTWMSGDPQNTAVSYGTKGVPSVSNFPGKNASNPWEDRYGVASWKDKNGLLWLYTRDELWKYNTASNEWTWVSGDATTALAPVYGQKGVPSVNNTPGTVMDAGSWTDLYGNFWLLHGDDIWKYNPDTGEWTWMGGDENNFGIYGNKGVAAPGNEPGARSGAVSWTDNHNNLWLFGGLGWANSNQGYLKDLWKFTPSVPVPSISTSLSALSYYKGATLTIGYTAQGSFGADNTFTAQLSDASGSFLNPVAIGTTRATGSGTITATIPFATTAGTGYRIRVVSNMPAITGSDNGADVTINNLPASSTSASHSISTTALASNMLYQGKEVSISYTATGTYNSGTAFYAQLSDATGSFANPAFIGSVVASGSGTITAIIPSATPAGTAYRVRVITVAGNEPVIGGDNGTNLSIAPQPPYPAVSGSWTWMSGDNVVNQPGIYGTKGVASTENKPGAREGAVSWKDKNGNLWLYGGSGYSSNTTVGFLNDLWKYNPATREWTWVSGDNVINQSGVYGTKGVAGPDTKPGARNGAAGWTDKSGNLWLYGGNINDANGGELNDLWKFDVTTNQWTWVSGDPVTVAQGIVGDFNAYPFYGVYGTKGVPSVNNKPPAKTHAITWTDNDGNFWLYSGYAYYGYLSGHMTDLWKFNPLTTEWTFVTRATAFPHADGKPRYGVKGVASPDNKPLGRQDAVGWVDKDNNLWLYGGYTVYTNVENFIAFGSFRRTLADLWLFNTTTGLWTWMGGERFEPPVYPPASLPVRGTKGVPSVDNHPGAARSGVSWTDAADKFWLLNGDDLWRYDQDNFSWTWVSGDENDLGVYGTKGNSSPSNEPGARSEAVSWTGADGKLWLFGGRGFASTGTSGLLNDLWSFGVETETRTLTTSVLFTGVCTGSKLNISYTSSHSFNPGNTFTVQLSDASGSFASPVTIGSASATTPGIIEVLIPANTPAGNGYRIRVVSSSPAVVGEDNGTNLSINTLPTITVSGGVSGGSSVVSSGLQYKYYEGSWTRLPDFGGLTPVATGSAANVSLAPRKRDDRFAFLFEGSIIIPKAGRYYIETSSDDGSKLYIGNYGHYNTPVVDNDGQHGLQTRGGWYTFKEAGRYDIAISYFEQGGDQQLMVYWGSTDAGIAMHTPIPDAAFGPPASVTSTLTYQYYEGSWTSLPDFGGLKPVETGHVTIIDLSRRKRDEQFAFLFQGKINIPKAGRYYFETASDDGSRLYIGNYGHFVTPVVDNDGQHALQTRGGWYSFPSAGQYDIAVSFFEQGGDQQLKVYWGSEDGGIPMHTAIPESAFRKEGAATACAGSVLTASEGEGYRWSTGETTRSITVTQNGSYSVTVTKGGCSTTSEPTVINCIDNSITQMGGGKGSMAQGVAASSGLSVKALPNPSPSHFTLQLSSAQVKERITIRILDGVGRLVETKVIAAGTPVQVGHTLRPGTYFAEVVQGVEKVTLKLVKTGAF